LPKKISFPPRKLAGGGGKNGKSHPLVIYHVGRFSDIEEKIIPFLNKYSLQGAKRLEFED
jgi:hypothetical protein